MWQKECSFAYTLHGWENPHWMTKFWSYYKEICQSQFNKHDGKSFRILKFKQFLLVVLSEYAYSVKGSAVNIYQSWRHAWKVYTDFNNTLRFWSYCSFLSGPCSTYAHLPCLNLTMCISQSCLSTKLLYVQVFNPDQRLFAHSLLLMSQFNLHYFAFHLIHQQLAHNINTGLNYSRFLWSWRKNWHNLPLSQTHAYLDTVLLSSSQVCTQSISGRLQEDGLLLSVITSSEP